MKRLIILFFLGSLTCYGQGNSRHQNAFYVRAGIYEISFGYQHRFNKIGVGMEADYRPAFKNVSYNNSFPTLSIAASMETIRLRGLLNIFLKNNNFLSAMCFFRKGQADKIIFDPGKFGGSNQSEYAEYSEMNNEIGLGVFMHRRFIHHPAIQVYIGASVAYKIADQHYSVKGTYSYQTPVDTTETKNWVVPGLYAGLKFDIFRF